MLSGAARPHRTLFARTRIISLLVFFVMCLAAPTAIVALQANTSPLQRAWTQAQAAGAYTYDAHATVETQPNPTLANVGLAPKQEQFTVRGTIDRAARSTDLQLWVGGGTQLRENTALALRLRDGQVWQRNAGGAWELSDTTLDMLAPGNDVMAFLAAARNVGAGEHVTRGGIDITRYTFALDGRAFAETMRTGIEAELRRQGRSAGDVPLSAIESLLGVSGTGELWVGADGLPVRQIVSYSMQDPGQPQTFRIMLTSDFSQYAPVPAWRGAAAWIAAFDWLPLLVSLAALVAALAVLPSLLQRRTSRPVYVATVALVLFSMLAVPAMPRAQAAERTTKPAETKQAQKPVAQLTQRDVHAPVRAAAPAVLIQRQAQSGTDTDRDGLSDSDEAVIGTSPSVADSDGDGLNDGVEALEIGTRPTSNDTDGDGLSDGLEVSGIKGPDGRMWYLDPFAGDSNADGISDFLECFKQPFCPDTDGDTVPDAFDDDNDNDGVLDRMDTSPDVAVSARDSANKLVGVPNGTLGFALNDYAANKPLLVNFAIRPTNPSHLTFSGSVLDWPEDTEGQVQAATQQTFGSTGREANGNMRLVPMLEIEIPYQPGTFGGLPVKANSSLTDIPSLTDADVADSAKLNAWYDRWLDRDKLASYQIIVRPKDTSRTMLAYVPLDVLRDATSGSPVAFTAQMYYRPIAAAMAQQSVRLSWTVQLLGDRCSPPPAADSAAGETFNNAQWNAQPAATRGDYVAWKNLTDTQRAATWCADTSNRVSENNPIHTYYDDFVVSSMTATEERGLHVATVLADPSTGTSTFQPYLWSLARNLDQTFIGGRDCNSVANSQCQGDGTRDITVSEIKRRFDRGSIASSAERWGIPNTALRVSTQSFAEQGEMGRLFAGYRENGQDHNALLLDFLNNTYGATNSAGVADPTLLMARERRVRLASLGADSTIGANNGTVAISFAGVPELTQASTQWQPFSFQGSAVWKPADLDTYVNNLDATYTPLLQQAGGAVGGTAEQRAGSVKLLQNWYVAMHGGRAQVVEKNGVAFATSDPQLADVNLGVPADAKTTLARTAQSMADLLLSGQRHRALLLDVDAGGVLAALGRQRLYGDGGAALTLFERPGNLGGSGATQQLLVNALAGVATNFMNNKVESEIAESASSVNDWTSNALGLVSAVGDSTVLLLARSIKGTNTFKAALEALDGATSVVAASSRAQSAAKVLGRVAMALTALTEVIAFTCKLISLLAQGADGWGIADLVATTVASVSIAVLLTVIGGIVPIGTVIAFVLGVIDLIIFGICKLAGVDEKSNKIAQFACEGITGNIVKLFKALLWDDTPLIDLEDKDRMNLQNWKIAPRDPVSNANTGYMAGNQIDIQTDVTTKLPTKTYAVVRGGYNQPPLGEAALNRALTESTFRYQFTPTEEKKDQRIDKRFDIKLGQMTAKWQKSTDGVFSTTQTVSTSLKLNDPGINWKPNSLYLAEGYAIDSVLCVAIVICPTRTKTDSTYLNIADNFVYDVFPDSLDSFYSLTDRGNGGFALDWDAKFPVLADADNDGLRSKTQGGNDPSDNSADTDGDGLSDWYEVQHAAQGFDPNKADTDGDGLSDLAEAKLGLDPAQADVDNDGLTDKEEIDGWQIVYGYDATNQPLRFRTSSDPRDSDTDKDGILDKQERTYGFNPRVFNNGAVLQILSQVDERDGAQDGFVADNSQIGYTSAITNTLRDRYALGLYEVDTPSAASASTLQPQQYLLGPQQQISINGTLNLRDLSASQKISLATRAGAIISDQRALAGGRVAWLHFDETSGATTWSDSSTYNNNAACATSGACPISGGDAYQGRGIVTRTANNQKALVQVPHAATLPNDRFSISVWIKPQTDTGYQDIVSKQQGAGSKISYVLGLAPNTLKARLVVQNQACSAISEVQSNGQLNAGVWNLLTATYDGSALRLFLNGVADGQLAYSGGMCANTAPVQIGNVKDGTGLDELSIYPFALTAAEVLAQFRDPLLRLTFDGSLADSSQFHQQTVLQGQNTIALPNREVGKAARFDKKRWVTAGPSVNLDLSGGSGQWTLATWVRPEPLGVDRNKASWQGLLGRDAGNNSYPSLEMQFTDNNTNGSMRAYFGNGSARCESASTGAWLAPNEWQHVAVSFTGTQFIFYRNGVQKEALALPANCAGNPRPAAGNTLYIGRTSPNAQLELLKIQVTEVGDASPTAEYDAYWDRERSPNPFWSRDNIGRGMLSDVGGTRDINDDNPHVYELYEDDGPDGYSSGDDEQINKTFRNIDVSTGNDNATKDVPYSGDGKGTLTYRLWNNFFNGELDDVRVYRSALSQADAAALYNVDAQSDVVQLRFEEPPTATLFRDGSGNLMHGLCSGTACPTSGLGGRDGQAVRFNGGQAVLVPDRPALDLPNSFTVAAWVKLDDPSVNQKIVSKFDQSGGGFILGVQNGQIYGEMKDPKGNAYAVRGGTIAANTWTHLAVTAAAGNYLIGYVNGQEVARTAILETGRVTIATAMPRRDAPNATLWDERDYSNDGDSLQVSGDIDSLSDMRNDTSSVSISDSCIGLYKYDKQNTLMTTICDNTPYVGDAADDDTVSVKLFREPPTTSNGWLNLNNDQRQFVAVEPKSVGEPQFSSMTIAANIALSQSSGTYVIASRGNNNDDYNDGKLNDGFRFEVANDRLRFSAGNGSWTGNTTIGTGERHVAVTIGAGSLRFYVDGQLDREFGGAPGINDVPDKRILIGRGPDCGGRTDCEFFKGRIRNLGMYTYPLNADQITSLKNNKPQDVGSTGRVLLLPFDESNGATNFRMPVTEPLGINDVPLTVGRASWGAFAATGMIDEVTVSEVALPQSGIQALIDRAPVANFHLDEALDAASFANDAASSLNGTCTGAACPKAGAKGRIRDGLVFNGTSTAAAVNDANALDLDSFSIEMWVRPGAIKAAIQPLLAKGSAANPNYLLAIAPNGLNAQISACTTSLTSQKALNQEQWNHLVATYDGATLRLFLNGTLDSSKALSGSACKNTSRLFLGGQPDDNTWFDGMLDEVQLFRSALRAEDVNEHYQYQESWFDIVERHDLTIDADAPTVRVDLPENAVIPSGERVLAIVAQDATSPIKTVEVNTGNGWQSATPDNEIWAFRYTPPASGTASIQVRATDVVGHSASSTRMLQIDSQAPTLTLDAALSAGVLRPAVNAADKTWTLALNGTATDALSAPVKVTATLRTSRQEIVGAPLTLSNINGAWSGSYRFPYPPTDKYMLELTAEDANGNSAVLANRLVTLDSAAPVADVTVGAGALATNGALPAAQANRAMRTNANTPSTSAAPPTLRGTASDNAAPAFAALALHFEEAAGATTFLDGSRDQRQAQCSGACPTAGVAGINGSALAFNGTNQSITVADALPATSGATRFTLSLWAKSAANANVQTLVSGTNGVSATLALRLQGTQLSAWLPLNGALAKVGAGTLTADQWNHIAFSFDGAQVTTFINGVPTGTQAYSATFDGLAQLWLGSERGDSAFYSGALDEVALYSRALTNDDVEQLADPVRSAVQAVNLRLVHAKDLAVPDAAAWQTTTITQTTSGYATWTYGVPAGIEGPYRVDLETADSKGNKHIVPNAWSGEIDTRAPQVALFAQTQPDGSVAVTCVARDYNLDGGSFTCPAPAASWQRSYQSAPWYTALTSVQKLESIRASATVPAGTPLAISACDSFGNCASSTANSSTAFAPGISVILAPSGKQVATSLDPITLNGYASAEAGLRSLDITAGGASLAKPAVSANQTSLPWSATFTPPGEGIYPIQARAEDANGAVYTDTIQPAIVVDFAPPMLALSSSVLTATAMLPNARAGISGVVTETHGLKTLEAQVAGNGWLTLATPKPGSSLPFTATVVVGAGPFDGQQTALALRARDLADRSGYLTHTLTLDNTPPSSTNLHITPSSSTARIAGTALDGSGVGLVEVGLLPSAQSSQPEQTVWRAAALAQSNASSTDWSLQVPASAGRSFVVSLRLTDRFGNRQTIANVWSGDLIKLAPQFTSALPAAARYGDAYQHTFVASGDPAITFSTGGTLPPGLSLNASSGVLSGAPTLAGTYSFTVTASSSWKPDATQQITLEVAKAPLAVTLDDRTKIYGQANPALTFRVDSAQLRNGDTANVLTGTAATVATAGSAVGTYAITAGALDAANYALSITPGVLTVEAAPLQVTVDDVTRKLGTSNPAFAVRYTGFVVGDTVADLDTAATASTTATIDSPLGTYPITVDGGADQNYRFSYTPGTFTVVAQDVPLISWSNPVSITYGTALGTAQLNASASFNGQTVAGSFSYDPPAGQVLNAGNGQLLRVVFTPADRANYAPVSANVQVDVLPAPLVVTAQSQAIVAGEALPQLRYTVSGLVNNDTEADLDVQVTISTSATANSPVGSYPISVSGGTDANYATMHAAGVLVIQQAGPSLTVLSDDHAAPGSYLTFAAQDFMPNEQLSIAVGNNTVLATQADGDGKAVFVLHFGEGTPPGTYTVRASSVEQAQQGKMAIQQVQAARLALAEVTIDANAPRLTQPSDPALPQANAFPTLYLPLVRK